jgi:hypothetical protein
MASSENPAHSDYDTASEKYDAAHRRELADAGIALPDGSYPVADAEDLHHAIHAVGRGRHDSHDAIRRMVSARARSALALRRQKRPPLRQQFLNRRFEPHGHKSLSPRRSANSTSPPRMVRGPRFTCVSDGKPLRRLLIGSKGEGLLWICLLSWHGCLLALIAFAA